MIARFALSIECVRFVSDKFFMLDSGFTFDISDKYRGEVSKDFIGNVLLNIQDQIYSNARGHAQKNLDINSFKKITIPLPPLHVQEEIVNEIKGYQKIVDVARNMVIQKFEQKIKDRILEIWKD